MITEKRGGFYLEDLDPRMKLLILFVFTTVAYMANSIKTLAFMYLLIVLLFLLNKTIKEGLKVMVLFLLLLMIDHGASHYINEDGGQNLLMILYIIERVSVIFVMSFWMSLKLRIGDFTTAMQNMHFPRGLTITLAVVFRYIPTIKEEFSYIKTAMALRGISFSFKNFLLHPVETMEFIIVPLMMRSFKIADELSASAMARGLSLEQRRSCYREVRLTASDITVTAVIITVVLLGNYYIGGIA